MIALLTQGCCLGNGKNKEKRLRLENGVVKSKKKNHQAEDSDAKQSQAPAVRFFLSPQEGAN